MPRVSRKPPPNHKNPDFWPEVHDHVLLLAQEQQLGKEFIAWWDKLRTAAGNAHAYASKGYPEQVAKGIVAEYRARSTRSAAATR